jgi:hypothetical protein
MIYLDGLVELEDFDGVKPTGGGYTFHEDQ